MFQYKKIWYSWATVCSNTPGWISRLQSNCMMHSEALCLLIKMSQIKDFENCWGALTLPSTCWPFHWDQKFNTEADRQMIIVSLIPENTHTHTPPKRTSNLKRLLEEPLWVNSPFALKCSFSHSYYSGTPKFSNKS